MAKELNVLAISYGRNFFESNNIERRRMELCAGEVTSFHMVVFTKRSDNLSVVHGDNGLVIHPTNSKTKLHMIADAVRIGAAILKSRTGKWVVTTQDPFEAGLVGYLLTHRHTATLNIQEHGDFFSTNAWRKESVLNQIRFQLGKWLLRKADTVRVVSDRIEATVQHLGVSAENINRLSVRTDDGMQNDTSVDLHAEYPEASVIVLSMARFVPQKNLSLLIESFSELYKEDDTALLVIIGEGVQQQKLRDVVVEYNLEDAVVFKEWTVTPQAYIRSADIYALSSNYEGWARVLIESMLMGTPVVTTDVGCAGEVLLNDVHGFVVPVGDIALFAEKLKILAVDTDLRRRFSISAKHDVADAHSTPEAYATAWAQVLQ